MGICCSSTSATTTKLILQDGTLKEFSHPIRVFQILQENPNCFICNADDMDFDNILSPLKEEEELQPGELYFALPLNWLNTHLKAEEMASLAVKASLALQFGSGGGSGGGGGGGGVGSCGCYCGCGMGRRMDQVMFRSNSSKRDKSSYNEETVSFAQHGAGSGGGYYCDERCGDHKKERSTNGGIKRRRFAATLGVILEELEKYDDKE